MARNQIGRGCAAQVQLGPGTVNESVFREPANGEAELIGNDWEATAQTADIVAAVEMLRILQGA